ncbi:MAG: hypothetical protein MJY77_05175 [Bacteroidaceae bacterium]|nr:hypothetical protein [Bacteroidaceae bacterium]
MKKDYCRPVVRCISVGTGRSILSVSTEFETTGFDTERRGSESDFD